MSRASSFHAALVVLLSAASACSEEPGPCDPDETGCRSLEELIADIPEGVDAEDWEYIATWTWESAEEALGPYYPNIRIDQLKENWAQSHSEPAGWREGDPVFHCEDGIVARDIDATLYWEVPTPPDSPYYHCSRRVPYRYTIFSSLSCEHGVGVRDIEVGEPEVCCHTVICCTDCTPSCWPD